MNKKTALLQSLLFFTGLVSYAQVPSSFTKENQSFVMGCYYKKFSDTIRLKPSGDYISDYRRCKTCREEFENSKIVQRVYTAQLTNDPVPYSNSKYGPDYYRYYRNVITRKYPGVVFKW